VRTAVVVDDDVDIRALLDVFLRLHDVRVVGQAADGAAALDLVNESHPDVVVLDLTMPEHGGLEALPQIRAAAPSSTVVVFSAHLTRAALTSVRGIGAWAVEKSAGLSALGAALDEATAHPWGGG
jgi:DNA-binding NarL/FixJ family response regulator